jgi:molybdenum cofactor biosynthesis protein B
MSRRLIRCPLEEACASRWPSATDDSSYSPSNAHSWQTTWYLPAIHFVPFRYILTLLLSDIIPIVPPETVVRVFIDRDRCGSMVDFQSRDTRRGPTDGDDEAGDDETSADEESTQADTETTGGESTESAADEDVAASDDVATTEAETSATDDTEATGSSPPAAERDNAVADKIDEAADRSTDSQSTADQQAADPQAEETQRSDGDATPETRGTDGDTAPETQAGSQPGDTPPAEGPTADERPEQTAPRTDAPEDERVTAAVVTVGTATAEGDPTGEAVEAALEATGQTVTARERLRGDYDGIQGAVDRLVRRDDVEVVVTAGGLGVSASEQTLEAVHPLFEKALPGFEEVYRSLLFEQQGTGVIAVRATAGIADGTPVFCLPADPAAARVGIEKVIAAEAPSLVAQLP